MDPFWADTTWASFWHASWVWAILLLVMGLGLVVLEVFIPSGGILGFVAVCSIVAAIVVGFMEGPGVGFTILTSAVVAGQRVRVIKVQGNRVVVRPVDEELPPSTDSDPLSRPIDTLGLDPFEDPPA